MALQIFYSEVGPVRTLSHESVAYFNGADVARCLGYSNPRREVRRRVHEEDLRHLGELLPGPRKENKALYINEPGVYALIFNSDTPAARTFKKYVYQTLLPSLRRASTAQCRAPLALNSEADLHHKIIEFVRRFYPHALLAPGLGEIQDTAGRRAYCWRSGYQGGQPDILVLNHHVRFSGFALELKHPAGKGRVTDRQVDYLEQLRAANFKTLVTCDYDLCVKELVDYFQQTRICCPDCRRKFKTHESLAAHLAHFHKRLLYPFTTRRLKKDR